MNFLPRLWKFLKALVRKHRIKVCLGTLSIVLAFTLYYGDFFIGMHMLAGSLMNVLVIPFQVFTSSVQNVMPKWPKKLVFCAPGIPIELPDIIKTDCNVPRRSDDAPTPMTRLFGEKYSQQDYLMCRKFAGCVPCPENGECDADGKLTCDVGYIAIRDSCEVNQALHLRAHEAVMQVREELSLNLGQQMCNDIRAPFWISRSAFDARINELAGSFEKSEFLASALSWVLYDIDLLRSTSDLTALRYLEFDKVPEGDLYYYAFTPVYDF